MAESSAQNRKKKIDTSSLPQAFEPGKMPPQAVDLEEAVLGALMLEKEAVNDVIDVLSKESFYKEVHQKIYGAILTLFAESKPIDILTVTEQLRTNGELELVGGPYYISQLTNRVASAANIEFHARIISQKHIQRELIRISSETIKDAYDETTDVFDLLDKAESSLFKVAEGNIRKNYDSMTELIQQAIKQVEDLSHKTDGVSGIPTGFHDLDRVTSGFQPSDMVVLAARPGMGKTAFVLSLARNTAVEFNHPVAVFSLEMSSLQLVNRLIASETELSAEKLKKGQLQDHEWQQLHAKIGKLADAPIFIDDTPALSVFELRAKCRRLKAQHDIQMVIIDYLQLMTAGGEKGNREQEISTISRSVKSIAKELNVPIIALSQLSRAVETRGGDKKPQLSDLRESGAIEQDADMVMFIYRPEYYGITTDEAGESVEGMGEIIIAKHRNGALENIHLKFIANLAKFANLETSDEFHFNSGEMPTSDEFGNTTQIRKSRMDDLENDDYSSNESAPF
ncbi:replicative DNA helicase [Salibacter halophilus]|uniref:Replicative DNA helicase n=1 Tax=Salibacter halophilus TaxID=1803916 RepID=A0A6N6M567_9FLAO|nr:replicative DNA helicase [Salibacter halophilus]KAB1062651.1 replicative DNA helicase [Salibacter halophilus]